MTPENLLIWLRERTVLGVFSEEIVEAIARLLQPQTRAANEKIITQNNPADGLYILQTGRLETAIAILFELCQKSCRFLGMGNGELGMGNSFGVFF